MSLYKAAIGFMKITLTEALDAYAVCIKDMAELYPDSSELTKNRIGSFSVFSGTFADFGRTLAETVKSGASKKNIPVPSVEKFCPKLKLVKVTLQELSGLP